MTQQEHQGIKLSIDSRLENIGLVGLAVQALCAYVGFSESDAYQIQLCIVEAVNNVVKHAYGGQPGHEAVVVVKVFPDRISFQIVNTGKTMEPTKQKKIEFVPADRAALPESGWGLHIIRTVMDEVSYQTVDGTNIFTLDKYLPKAG